MRTADPGSAKTDVALQRYGRKNGRDTGRTWASSPRYMGCYPKMVAMIETNLAIEGDKSIAIEKQRALPS